MVIIARVIIAHVGEGEEGYHLMVIFEFGNQIIPEQMKMDVCMNMT
jgi:hypothetical protein